MGKQIKSSPEKGHKKKRKKLKKINCGASRSGLINHYKNFQEAVKYIWDFLKHPQFPDWAINYGAGMEIGSESLQDFYPKKLKHCGLMLYLCRRGDLAGYYFSLSYKIKEKMNDEIPQFRIPHPDYDDYYWSDCDFKFPNNLSNLTDLLSELVTYSNQCSFTGNPSAHDDTNQCGQDFLDLINDPIIMAEPIAFFHKNQIVDVLAQQPGVKGIRFYLGYGDHSQGPYVDCHKIKLVAFGIDTGGKNIINKVDGSPGVILQHSWPPY